VKEPVYLNKYPMPHMRVELEGAWWVVTKVHAERAGHKMENPLRWIVEAERE
jgi:hypothetical protein